MQPDPHFHLALLLALRDARAAGFTHFAAALERLLKQHNTTHEK